MQNAIRSFPSYSTWDMFSNTVTYNTKIGVYIVQLLSQFLSCIQICYYEIISHTPDLPLIPNTHTHMHALSLSPRVSLHPYLLLSHTIKSEHTPFFGCTKKTNSHFCWYFLSFNCIPRGVSTAPQGALLKFPMLHFIWLFGRRGLESDH